MISDADFLFKRRKRRLPASGLLYPHFRSPKRKHFFFESSPIPPEARSPAFDMGNYLSSSLPDCMRRDGGLRVFRGWVRASQDARDLTVATSDDVELGQVVLRRIDPTKVARQAVPPPREKRKPFYKEALERTGLYDKRLGEIAVEVTLQNEVLDELRKAPKEDLSQLFIPLTAEDENEVHNCLYDRSSSKVLVLHEPSNIEVSVEKFRCLRPHGWLNDEVINLYLELLKERGIREPKRFLKCHFFNTFFYKKLACGKNGYDYRSVKRWTTCRKLGYELIDCDRIFVPVHQNVHWCLAVINMKEKRFQYLDSMGGNGSRVPTMLAKYIVDEVKDKSNKEIDISSWKEELLDYVPLQQNGWDCGMFMLKYIDFYSRGLSLSFSQEHMEYFRKRTAKEILRLRAD